MASYLKCHVISVWGKKRVYFILLSRKRQSNIVLREETYIKRCVILLCFTIDKDFYTSKYINMDFREYFKNVKRSAMRQEGNYNDSYIPTYLHVLIFCYGIKNILLL